MADPRISSDPQDDEDVDLEGESNCALLAAGSFISGGVLGGLVGLAGGVFKREGLKVAMQEGATSAKTFALMSGVHSLVTCGLQKLRNKDDVVNQGIAGCASGIALAIGGPPSTMMVNCAGFAAFAFIYEMLTARSAIAMTCTGSGASMNRRGRVQARRNSGCRLPICQGGNKLKEVLSLGLPCWLLEGPGCTLATSHQQR